MAWESRPVNHKTGARNSRRRDECVMANKSVAIFIASCIRMNRSCRCPTRRSKSAERRPCGAKCTSAFQINSSRAQWQCIAHYQTEAFCRFASAFSPLLDKHSLASHFWTALPARQLFTAPWRPPTPSIVAYGKARRGAALDCISGTLGGQELQSPWS